MTGSEAFRIIRLQRDGDEFVERRAELWEDTRVDAATRRYLDQRCEVLDRGAHVRGHGRVSPLYVPRNEPDTAYAVVPESASPDEASSHGPPTGLLVNYATTLRRLLSVREPLPHLPRREIAETYVEPTLTLMSPGRLPAPIRWEHVTELSMVVVVGPAGSGKTTLLRRLALVHAERLSGDEFSGPVPVFLHLRDFADQGITRDTIRRVLATDREDAAAHVDDVISSRKLLLILDGLDEVVNTRREAIVQDILTIRAQLEDVAIIVSTRPTTGPEKLPGFNLVEVEPFSLEQIAEWLWLMDPDADRWEGLLRQLTESPALASMVRNPLLLAVTAYLIRSQAVAPHQQATLVQHHARALIEEWDRSRGVRRRSDEIDARRAYATLCRWAYKSMDEDRLRFAAQDTERWSPPSPDELPGPPSLEVLAEQTAILLPRPAGEWEFADIALRDFLAATYIVESSADATEYLRGKLVSESGRSVWSLATGSALNAGPLFEMLLDAEEISESHRAQLVVEGLAQVVDTERSVLDAAIEFVALYLERQLGSVSDARRSDRREELALEMLTCRLTRDPAEHDRALEAMRTLERISAARDSAWGKALLRRLANSEVPTVAMAATAILGEMPTSAWLTSAVAGERLHLIARWRRSPGSNVATLFERILRR